MAAVIEMASAINGGGNGVAAKAGEQQ